MTPLRRNKDISKKRRKESVVFGSRKDPAAGTKTSKRSRAPCEKARKNLGRMSGCNILKESWPRSKRGMVEAELLTGTSIGKMGYDRVKTLGRRREGTGLARVPERGGSSPHARPSGETSRPQGRDHVGESITLRKGGKGGELILQRTGRTNLSRGDRLSRQETSRT